MKKNILGIFALFAVIGMILSNGLVRISGTPKMNNINYVDNTESEVSPDKIQVDLIKDGKKKVLKFNKDIGFPSIKKDRTYVPIRVISEEMGYKVDWDGKISTVNIVSKTGDEILLTVGESEAIVNGKKVNIDEVTAGNSKGSKSYIYNSRTYVPLRFISEVFKSTVDYKYDKLSKMHYIVINMDKDNEPVDVEKGEWIEPKFLVEFPKEGDHDGTIVNLELINVKTFTDKNADAKFEISLENKEYWSKYKKGYSAFFDAKNPTHFDHSKDLEDYTYIPKGTKRKEFMFISFIPGTNYFEDMTPKTKPESGTELKINVKATINGHEKLYTFQHKF